MAPASPQSYAFVTLLSSSSYLPGALVLGHALRQLHPKSTNSIPFKLVCLVTPETVDAASVKALRDVWDLVVGVEVLEHAAQAEGLSLLGRPDLASVLTKLHVFRLTPFSKVIFLDADVLPLRPLTHLFGLPHPFSAAPDTGWPDCFNSGVMVLEPSDSTFEGLRAMLASGRGVAGYGSFDGGDQGILNQYFNGEDGRPEWNRISFTYNTTPTAAYTYAPAYKHYGPSISAVHFIGNQKPWSALGYRAPRPQPPSDLPYDYASLVDRWFAVYDKYVRPTLDANVPGNWAVPKTVAAWETPRTEKASLGLDDLKRVAEHGWSKRKLEGGYTSLPLDGRIDLMRPRVAEKEQQPHQEEHTQANVAAVAPTQASAFVPAQAPAPAPAPPPPPPSHIESPVPQHAPGGTYLATWDATREPPPSGGGAEHHQMREPISEHYSNAWDESDSSADARRWREAEQARQAIWTVPAELQDGRYNMTAKEADASRVTKVFPWESGHRRTPSRVFPKGSTPPPQNTLPSPPRDTPALSVQAATPSPPATETSSSPSAPVPPRPRNFNEAMRSYTNAWDEVPSIRRYVDRMVGNHTGRPSVAYQGIEDRGRNSKDDRSDRRRAPSERSRDGGTDGDDEEEDETSEDLEAETRIKGAQSPKGPPGGPSRRHGRGGDGGAGGAGGGSGGAATGGTQSRGVGGGSGTGRISPRNGGGGGGGGGKGGGNYSGRQHHARPQHLHHSLSHSAAQTDIVTQKDASAQTPPADELSFGARHFRVSSAESVTSAGVQTPEGNGNANDAPSPGSIGRSWDPARDVGSFKKGTEQVLQRFIREAQEEQRA